MYLFEELVRKANKHACGEAHELEDCGVQQFYRLLANQENMYEVVNYSLAVSSLGTAKYYEAKKIFEEGFGQCQRFNYSHNQSSFIGKDTRIGYKRLVGLDVSEQAFLEANNFRNTENGAVIYYSDELKSPGPDKNIYCISGGSLDENGLKNLVDHGPKTLFHGEGLFLTRSKGQFIVVKDPSSRLGIKIPSDICMKELGNQQDLKLSMQNTAFEWFAKNLKINIKGKKQLIPRPSFDYYIKIANNEKGIESPKFELSDFVECVGIFVDQVNHALKEVYLWNIKEYVGEINVEYIGDLSKDFDRLEMTAINFKSSNDDGPIPADPTIAGIAEVILANDYFKAKCDHLKNESNKRRNTEIK